VYVSEAFAATLAATASRRYALEYVGRLPLAKNYGEAADLPAESVASASRSGPGQQGRCQRLVSTIN